jgi:arginyl-tRNA synthetase
MSVLARLSTVFGEAFASLGLDPSHGAVGVSQRPDLAQYQCNGAMAAAREAGRNPRDLAAAVIDAITDRSPYRDLSIAGPGFINITLTDEYLAGAIDRLRGDDRLGHVAADPRRVLVDYGGPNVAKPMHVGHLRATVIGESLVRLFRFAGHRVWGDAHFGDWGTQMGQVIIGIEDRMPDLPYFDPDHEGPYPDESPVGLADLQEIYPLVAAACRREPEMAERARAATLDLQQGRPGYRALWEHLAAVSMESQKRDFLDLGTEFDLWFGESSVHDRIAGLIARFQANGAARPDAGALVIDVAAADDKTDIPPLLLAKSDGAYMYGTTDLATIDYRVQELEADTLLYVVDARQGLHFEQVFRAARKGGIAGGDVTLEHVKFGTVNGPDGRPFKTRDGGSLRLRDLIDLVTAAAHERLAAEGIGLEYSSGEQAEIARRVGLAALKYGDLRNHRTTDYVFDLDRFVSFQGNTGPYLQYSAVRIKSILRNAADRGFATGPVAAPRDESERDLMLVLDRFPGTVDRAAALRAPNHLAELAYDLAVAFNRFYERCHILSESDPVRRGSWLSLVGLVLAMQTRLLDLLGIEVPERM